MTKQEIKKEYQKMSRQLKKQGLNYTCVMNSRQQELGTATICFFSSTDYEARVKRAESRLEDTEDIMKEAKQSAKHWGKDIDKLREWAADEKCSTRETWIDIVNAYDNGKLIEREYQREEERRKRFAESVKEDLKKHGTLKDQYEKGMKELEELKTAEPVKAFCDKAAARMQVEYKEEHKMTFWYLRFFYEAE